MRTRTASVLFLLIAALGLAAADPTWMVTELRAHEHKSSAFAFSPAVPEERVEAAGCVDGLAADLFPCDGIDLLSFVPLVEYAGDGRLADANPIDAQEGSDMWGWTDPADGTEYIILGKTNGVAFYDISDPTNPVHTASIENTSGIQLGWFDVKTYQDHAYVVSESGAYGMLVFDLKRLRDIDASDGPEVVLPDSVYAFNGSAHNIVINEESGFAYLVGGNAGLVVQDQCRSGLHMVDIRIPTAPTFAGCYLMDGGAATAANAVGFNSPTVAGVRSTGAYVHDAQCVIYHGPDADYDGREICINSAEDRVVIVDVTHKQLPTTIASFSYDNATYTHQGWLTEDHRYFILGDELDEEDTSLPVTRTMIFDLQDLDNPGEAMYHYAPYASIDHNLYTHDGAVYQSNYSVGLRVSDLDRVGKGILDEVAYFDVHPNSNGNEIGDAQDQGPSTADDTDGRIAFVGTWSNYPYFESGVVAISGYDGFWLVQLTDEATRAISE